MNFDWQTEENEIKKRVAALFDHPALTEIEAMEEAAPAGLKNLTRRYLGRLAEIGYLGLAIGPQARHEAMLLLAAQEETAQVSGSLFLTVETTARLFGGLIAGFGGPGLGREILEPLRAGQVIGAVALTEPGGTDSSSGRRTIGRAKNDGYLVSGTKGFVTNGLIADWLAVAGTVDHRPAFFLVQQGQTGLVLGPRLKTLGYHGLAVSALELTEVEVPSNLVLGPFDHDQALSLVRLVQDLILTIGSVGLAGRTLSAANQYARAYHRGDQPIFAHQEVRFKIADMVTLFQTAQLLTRRAVWFYSQGDREAEVLAACAKVFCAEAAEKIAALSLQIMAGRGYVSGNAVERGYREAKYAALAGTTSEVSRMNIADELLRRYPA